MLALLQGYLKKVALLLISTHKANLYKKDPIQYFQFFSALSDSDNEPCCPDRKEPCKYYWVTHEENYETA